MWEIDGRVRHYAWGSRSHLPELLDVPEDGSPWAEFWLGAHPLAPSRLSDGTGVGELVASDPHAILGEGVARAFHDELPFLLKVIAPERPLSLQVHPSRARARESFAAEEAAGLPLDSPQRNYRDRNHKPELLVALSPFTALCGFRTPRRATAILEGLGTRLTDRLHALLVENPTAHGMRAALRSLLSQSLRPDPGAVREVVAACDARARGGASPSVRIDRIVAELGMHHPGDPGAVAAMLLNPVSMQPGEAMYVPPGALHAYISGVGIEVAAASDNVLRAGLTEKRVDVEELLQCVSVSAAPPVRIAPERQSATTVAYYAPVDDFEVSFTTLDDGEAAGTGPHRVAGNGPRILLALEGGMTVAAGGDERTLVPGRALLVPASAGELSVRGRGRMVQASVP
ncbi:mannose-6-phosphate isomerase, class I [Brachybacterium endophyticum]|uniref:mannose-6-phosphate isomerase n=1 Tax=Brachybacterium endophyticum TaxID=2182385 RepID=A0A2U2RJT8_9MICO|nr:mannose-6-phosphate isomerase, class I [Brachybacterium endophyticum]PWH06137.1 mannose-6-phosphate isomerase, class I [Brachybacterium endophyticum]